MPLIYEKSLLPSLLIVLVGLPSLALVFFMRGVPLELWRPILLAAVGSWLLRGSLSRVFASTRNRVKIAVMASALAPGFWLTTLPGKSSDFFAGTLFYLILPSAIVCIVMAYRISSAVFAEPGPPN